MFDEIQVGNGVKDSLECLRSLSAQLRLKSTYAEQIEK